jgi:hypothetical protein
VKKSLISKNKKRVVCNGCHFLVFRSFTPLCLCKTMFLDNAIDKHVDLKGILLANTVNRSNKCSHKKLFSFKVIRIRAWIRKECEKKGISYGRKHK